MTAEARFEALAAAPRSELAALADRALASDVPVEVRAGPEVATIPLRLPVPGTTRTTVVVGHVAVTTCTVTLDGVRGDGARPGRDLAGAVAAAVCDAEVERGGGQAAAVGALVARVEQERRAEDRRLAREVALTRIDAES